MKDGLLEKLRNTPPDLLQERLREYQDFITLDFVTKLAETLAEIIASEGSEAAYQAVLLYVEIVKFAATTSNNPLFHAWTLKFQGLTAYLEEQKDEALNFLYSGLKIFQEYPQDGILGLAYSYEDIADIQRKSGEYEEAISCYRQAIEIRKSLSARLDVARNQRLLGNCLLEIGKTSEAIENLTQAVSELQESLSYLELTMCLNELGRAYSYLGIYQDAIRCLQKALDINQQHGFLEISLRFLANLASIYVKINRFDDARESLADAVHIVNLLRDSHKEVDLEIANIHLHLGVIAYKEEKLKEAISHVETAQNLCKNKGDTKMLAICENNLAAIMLRFAQKEKVKTTKSDFCWKAMRHLMDAMNLWRVLNEKNEIAFTQSLIGLAFFLLEDYQRAKKEYEKALAVCQDDEGEIILLEPAWVALHGIGKTVERLKEYDEALANYKKSIVLIENMRERLEEDASKISFFTDKMIIYRDIITLILLLSKTKEKQKYSEQDVLECIERCKARTLLEIMQEQMLPKIYSNDKSQIE